MLPLGIPENGHLAFTVTRDGDAIGTHVYRFQRQGKRTNVEIRTKIDYRFLSLPIYSFRHESKESWVSNKLAGLISVTDDNGEAIRIEVTRKGDGLLVQKDLGHLMVEPGIIPASLWNASLVEKTRLLATVGGDVLTTHATFVGEEALTVKGRAVMTRHFRLNGGFNRDVWYDRSSNVLVRVRFQAEDGSQVEYVRQH